MPSAACARHEPPPQSKKRTASAPTSTRSSKRQRSNLVSSPLTAPVLPPSPPSSRRLPRRRLSDNYPEARTTAQSTPPAAKAEQPVQSTTTTVSQTPRQDLDSSQETTCDAVAHWVNTAEWPSSTPGMSMSRSRESVSSAKRPVASLDQGAVSSSRHRSIQRRRLEESGIVVSSAGVPLSEEKVGLVESYFEGRPRSTTHLLFPRERFLQALDEVAYRNEARIVRDITPWILPSAAILRLCGESHLENIAEEVDVQWHCQSMGTTVPKPDYTAGICPEAFAPEDQKKLQHISNVRRPFLITPNLCYPFLICEAKAAEPGMSAAETQTLNAASCAVRNVIGVFEAAFGPDAPETRRLSGEPLVFTLSHDHLNVHLRCHYGVENATDTERPWKFYSWSIDTLNMRRPANCDRSYSFVRNIYEHFAPRHLDRLRRAAAALPVPETTAAKASTASLSSVAGDDETVAGAQSDDGFRKPSLPASRDGALVDRLLRQLDEQRQRMDEQQRQANERQQNLEKMVQDLLSKRA